MLRHSQRSLAAAPALRPLARRAIAAPARRFSSALIHEVTPRDGLQNEKAILSLDQKLGLVRRLVESQPDSIELTSFVRADIIPAMADSTDLCLALNDADWALEAKAKGMHFAGLVPNVKGYEQLLKARGGRGGDAVLDTVVCIVSCSDSHSRANVRRPFTEALEATCTIIDRAKEEGLRVQAYASLAFGCPLEGDVDPDVVQGVVEKYAAHGADTIVLADTLGAGTPEQTTHLVSAAKRVVPVERLALHMHDTRGNAQANVAAAAELGVRRFDCATGGCGGCNFVPGAKGNISTQATLAVLEAMGIAHGMDWERLGDAHAFLEAAVGRELAPEAVYNMSV